jgi:Zn ribbon nucleic-acid-binding protein
LQYALWAEGRDSSYAPTLADALLNAVEHQKKVYGSNVGLKTTKVASSKATKSGTTQKRFIASKVYACPKCKSQKIKVQHTGKEQRKCRCFDCGKCFSKRIE